MILTEWNLIQQGYVKTKDYYVLTSRSPGWLAIKRVYLFYTGEVNCKESYVNGLLHNASDDEPAWACFFKNGQVSTYEFRIKNVLHRLPEEGPAYATYSEDGALLASQYWINGIMQHHPYQWKKT